MGAKERYLFTSESVTEGHPDKVSDQVSDAVLDAILAVDPYGRVACETLVTTGLCLVAGEIFEAAAALECAHRWQVEQLVTLSILYCSTSFSRPARVMPVSLQLFSRNTLLMERAVPEVPMTSSARNAFSAAMFGSSSSCAFKIALRMRFWSYSPPAKKRSLLLTQPM